MVTELDKNINRPLVVVFVVGGDLNLTSTADS